MHRISIIQIGDVHFEHFIDRETDVDDKDVLASPGNVGTALRKSVPTLIAQALQEQVDAAKPVLVAICGDLANRGDLDQFSKAARFLSDALGPGGVEVAHLVPGNHDVDLSEDMAFVDLESDRFAHLQDLMDAAGLKFVVTTNSRRTLSHAGEAKVAVLSVNTALANGAPRLLSELNMPDPIAEELRQADRQGLLTNSGALASRIADQQPLLTLQEVLDIPMIDPESLDYFDQLCGEVDQTHLPVMIAHHGFLPQHTPRLGPYTEMINGGQVRRRLLDLQRPVLYLHGHIHRDVVEIIHGPGGGDKADRPPLISVAAPQLGEGFNRIDLEFMTGGQLLGISISRFRVNDMSGTVALSGSPERVSFVNRYRFPDVAHKLLVSLVESKIGSGYDILTKAKSLGVNLSGLEIEDLVMSFCWQGHFRALGSSSLSFLSQEFRFL